MEVIIGRHKETNQLKITIGKREKICGAPGSVPYSVSRNHCSLTIGDDGSILMKNLNPENETFVNGIGFASRQIKYNDELTLGYDHYKFDWNFIEELFPVELDIRPLKAVWEKYKGDQMAIQIKERRFNAISRIAGLFSMGAMVLTFAQGNSADGDLGARQYMYYAAIIFTLAITAISYFNASRIPNKNKQLDEWFQAHYVCPNKKCQHFVGNVPYNVLAQNAGCPHCKAKYVKK